MGIKPLEWPNTRCLPAINPAVHVGGADLGKQGKVKIVGDMYNQIHETHVQYLHIWMKETFLHWDWWVALILTVAPWLIWWMLRKQESSFRLFFVAIFVMTVTSWFDFLGVIFGAWHYSGKLVPTIPTYMPFDFCIFPVLITLMIQYKPNVPPWLKAVFFGACCAFIFEPIFAWMKFYILVHWKYIYSFPIYILIYLAADWMSKRKSFALIGNHD